MELLLWGGSILEMDLVLSGSIIIPSLDTMNPSILPSSTTHIFFGIEWDSIYYASVENSP